MNQTVHIITSPRGASWRHDPLAWGPKSTPLELLLQKTVPKQLNNPLAPFCPPGATSKPCFCNDRYHRPSMETTVRSHPWRPPPSSSGETADSSEARCGGAIGGTVLDHVLKLQVFWTIRFHQVMGVPASLRCSVLWKRQMCGTSSFILGWFDG